MAALELVEGTARVALLHDVGGAIAAFTWRGRDVLRPMPAEAIAAGNVRLAACYPLVPYSNRIRDARARAQFRRSSARDPRRGLAARVAHRAR
jgi:aldose 1-epimerase